MCFLRVIGCFEVVKATEVDVNPKTGSSNASKSGRSPRSYEVYFKNLNEKYLREALVKKEFEHRCP